MLKPRDAVLLFVAAILACRDSGSGSPTTGSTTGSASGSAAPDPKQQRAEAALGRVNSIQPKLAKLRGLPFDRAVPTAYQTAEDFKAFLHREITKELPADKSAKLSKAYFHIGLLQQPIDLATASEQTMASQAAAYYDPSAKKFFVVMVPESDVILDTMSAHELTHGLQDQRFDLLKFLATKPPLDDDAQVARQFITEGDATFSMLLYMTAEMSDSDDVKSLVDKVSGQIQIFAMMDLSAYGAMMKDQSASFKQIDPDLKKSMESITDLPPMIVRPLLDSYTKGARVVLTAYQQGGWPTVNALYKTPPQSTEQVLHPATKLFPNREAPKAVMLPKVEGEELVSNVLGELMWGVYFSLWVPEQAVKASEGWGGDRYTVVKRADGSLVAYHATIWDTAEDAKQFADAYEASFAKRFPSKDRKHALRVDNLKVFVLDGDDDAKLFTKWISETTFP